MSNNIPKLRFPEFTGEWEMLPLSHYLYEHKTKSDGKCVVHSVSVTKGVINQVEYLGRSFAASDTSKYNLVKPYDVIYTKSPTGSYPYGIIKQNKNPYNVIVSPLYAVYTPINKYVGYILDSYFESPVNTNNYLSSLIQKGAKNTIQISNDTFISKSIFLPSSLPEQEKIAGFLTEMDNLIGAQGLKVDALKEKKKGLMQQLFPQPGQTTPQLRFPGFTGQWEEKKLGEILDYEQPQNYLVSNSDYKNIGIPVLTAGKTFILGYTDENDGIYNKTPVIIFDDFVTESKYVTFPFKVKSSAIKMLSLSDKSNNLRMIYESMQLLKYPIKEHKRYWISEYSKLIILLPTLPEQEKIAGFLTEMDNLIAAESEKLESLKSHKKGLMQQLFPQPEK